MPTGRNEPLRWEKFAGHRTGGTMANFSREVFFGFPYKHVRKPEQTII